MRISLHLLVSNKWLVVILFLLAFIDLNEIFIVNFSGVIEKPLLAAPVENVFSTFELVNQNVQSSYWPAYLVDTILVNLDSPFYFWMFAPNGIADFLLAYGLLFYISRISKNESNFIPINIKLYFNMACILLIVSMFIGYYVVPFLLGKDGPFFLMILLLAILHILTYLSTPVFTCIWLAAFIKITTSWENNIEGIENDSSIFQIAIKIFPYIIFYILSIEIIMYSISLLKFNSEVTLYFIKIAELVLLLILFPLPFYCIKNELKFQKGFTLLPKLWAHNFRKLVTLMLLIIVSGIPGTFINYVFNVDNRLSMYSYYDKWTPEVIFYAFMNLVYLIPTMTMLFAVILAFQTGQIKLPEEKNGLIE